MLPPTVSHPLVAHFNWQFGGGCQQEMKEGLAGSVEGPREKGDGQKKEQQEQLLCNTISRDMSQNLLSTGHVSINKQFTPHQPPTHQFSTQKPHPPMLGKAKIDTFNKSKEKNVACREFNPKKRQQKIGKGKEEESFNGGKMAGGKTNPFSGR